MEGEELSQALRTCLGPHSFISGPQSHYIFKKYFFVFENIMFPPSAKPCFTPILALFQTPDLNISNYIFSTCSVCIMFLICTLPRWTICCWITNFLPWRRLFLLLAKFLRCPSSLCRFESFDIYVGKENSSSRVLDSLGD